MDPLITDAARMNPLLLKLRHTARSDVDSLLVADAPHMSPLTQAKTPNTAAS